MPSTDEFLFKSYAFAPDTGALTLTYGFEGGPDFVERIEFPSPATPLTPETAQALDRAFRLVFLLAGVSYYKAFLSARLICQPFALDRATAAFCAKVYKSGLGEFAYRNNVTLNLSFAHDESEAPESIPLALPDRALVPVGGGKDSIVTLEALKRAGKDVTLFYCGGANIAKPVADTIRVAGLPVIHVRRFLCPKLMELNAQGALNGHVPITAIISAIAVATAIMHGFDQVILSNESSASEPNVIFGGMEVNHQYSKSFAFERDLAGYIFSAITPSIAYFSLLRPLTETAIASRFAKLPAYHDVFRSCNAAFRQDEAARATHWCCDCPKCRFVFLALAPFMPRLRLTEIFGADMLNDETQIQGYKELCGLSEHKPFECVGEVEESALLILRLAQVEEWKSNSVIAALAPRLQAKIPDAEVRFSKLLQMREPHQIPETYVRMITHESA